MDLKSLCEVVNAEHGIRIAKKATLLLSLEFGLVAKKGDRWLKRGIGG